MARDNVLQRIILAVACAGFFLSAGCGADTSPVDDVDSSQSQDADVSSDAEHTGAVDGDDAPDEVRAPDATAEDVEADSVVAPDTDDETDTIDASAPDSDSDVIDGAEDAPDSSDGSDPADIPDVSDVSDVSDTADSDEEVDTVDIVDAHDSSEPDGGPDPLTENEQLLLDLHNEARQGPLSPSPTPSLSDVSWDEGLAQVAQKYADKCIWAHNPDRREEYEAYGGSNSVGENLAAGYGTSAVPIAGFFGGWVGEASDYDYANNSCAPGEMCGHYTQVVWRGTTHVGCGWAQCDRLQGISDPRWRDVLYLVCNYSPAGNNGSRPY